MRTGGAIRLADVMGAFETRKDTDELVRLYVRSHICFEGVYNVGSNAWLHLGFQNNRWFEWIDTCDSECGSNGVGGKCIQECPSKDACKVTLSNWS